MRACVRACVYLRKRVRARARACVHVLVYVRACAYLCMYVHESVCAARANLVVKSVHPSWPRTPCRGWAWRQGGLGLGSIVALAWCANRCEQRVISTMEGGQSRAGNPTHSDLARWILSSASWICCRSIDMTAQPSVEHLLILEKPSTNVSITWGLYASGGGYGCG